jgi:hypothetical protein
MATRRDFLKGLGLSLAPLAAEAGADPAPLPAAGLLPPEVGPEPGPPTGSDVGSLFPFIRGQAVAGEFPLS